MANKIIGRTDTSGAVGLGTIKSNSKRPILLVGQGVDTTKEVIFDIQGTKDAIAHFGKNSPFVEITKMLILNDVKIIKGINVGEFGDDTKPYETMTDAYNAAFEVSMTDPDVMVLLLDTTDEAANDELPLHLQEAENRDVYRYAVVGLPNGLTDEQVIAAVKKMNNGRMFCPWPNMTDEDGNAMDGVYTAAAIAAILNTKTDDPALPTNNLTISGYSGVVKAYDDLGKTKLMDNGIIPMYNAGSVPGLYRMVTTALPVNDEDESVWHDATTRLIADNILASVLKKLKTNYKRTKNIARVLDSIRGDIALVLDNKLALEIIEEYDPALITVVKDPEDRYGALADFEYKVVSPLYTITVTQHLKI